ncbi:hypothetical protein [uncultured Jatrophihabitans sp.]|uniref:hypothetical protein n=1 Tax=uncultured Jatrophihabitans sp. TaxID=1610747 RepID=UPI0035CA6A9A
MSWTVLGYIIGAVLVLLGTIYTARTNRASNAATTRANQLIAQAQQQTESKRVDGEAYERAQEINQGIVKDLTDALDRVRAELAAVRTELAEAKAANADLTAAAEHLSHANVNLLGLLEQCKRLIEDNHLPMPEGV